MSVVVPLDEAGRKNRRDQAKHITDVLTLPAVFQRLLSIMDQAHSSTSQLEEIIKNDSALTARIIAVANSAHYGLNYKINTVHRAIMAIGFDELRKISQGVSLILHFKPKKSLEGLDFSLLWLHSLATAHAAQILSKHFPMLNPDSLYSAGILHDVGKVLLYTHFINDLEAIKAIKDEQNLPWPQAEDVYGLHHAELGAWVGEAWGLPPDLLNPIRDHHNPLYDNKDCLPSAIINLSDIFANLAGLNFMSEPPGPLNPALRDALKLTPDHFRNDWQVFVRKIPQIKQYWQSLLSS
jgi:putative nucleotidyltransferase with HDIG domain